MKKNILFMHSGGFWKNYTFKKAKGLAYGVILAQRDYKGHNPFVDRVISADACDAHKVIGDLSTYRNEIDGVVTFFELAVESAALIAEKWRLKGNTFDAAQNCRDKYRMRTCFQKAGIPSVDAFSAVESADDVKLFGKTHGDPSILKPRKFGAAAGVVRINRENEVEQLFNFVRREVENFCSTYGFPPEQSSLMVETMIDPKAMEVNVDMIIHNGEPLVVSIAEKPQDTTGPTFQENDYVMPPASLSKEKIEMVKTISMCAVRALGIRWGAAHLEAKASNNRDEFACHVLEVGARCGGDLEVPAVKASTGIDLSEIVIKQAAGDFSDSDFRQLKDRVLNTKPKHIAVQVLYAPKNGIIKNISIPREINNSDRLLDMKFEYQPGDKILMHYSDYVGAIMVHEIDSKTALDLVNKYVGMINIEMV
jgi:biotin carboxylase